MALPVSIYTSSKVPSFHPSPWTTSQLVNYQKKYAIPTIAFMKVNLQRSSREAVAEVPKGEILPEIYDAEYGLQTLTKAGLATFLETATAGIHLLSRLNTAEYNETIDKLLGNATSIRDFESNLVFFSDFGELKDAAVIKYVGRSNFHAYIQELFVSYFFSNLLRIEHSLWASPLCLGYTGCIPIDLKPLRCQRSERGVMIFERIRGATALTDYMAENNLTPIDTLSILLQAAIALSVSRDVFLYQHNDLDTGNILIHKVSDVNRPIEVKWRGRNIKLYTNLRIYIVDNGMATVGYSHDGKFFIASSSNFRSSTYADPHEEAPYELASELLPSSDIFALCYAMLFEDLEQPSIYSQMIMKFRGDDGLVGIHPANYIGAILETSQVTKDASWQGMTPIINYLISEYRGAGGKIRISKIEDQESFPMPDWIFNVHHIDDIDILNQIMKINVKSFKIYMNQLLRSGKESMPKLTLYGIYQIMGFLDKWKGSVNKSLGDIMRSNNDSPSLYSDALRVLALYAFVYNSADTLKTAEKIEAIITRSLSAPSLTYLQSSIQYNVMKILFSKTPVYTDADMIISRVPSLNAKRRAQEEQVELAIKTLNKARLSQYKDRLNALLRSINDAKMKGLKFLGNFTSSYHGKDEGISRMYEPGEVSLITWLRRTTPSSRMQKISSYLTEKMNISIDSDLIGLAICLGSVVSLINDLTEGILVCRQWRIKPSACKKAEDWRRKLTQHSYLKNMSEQHKLLIMDLAIWGKCIQVESQLYYPKDGRDHM